MKRATILAFVLATHLTEAFAQTGISTAELRGTVTDQTGSVLVSATISVVSRNTGQKLTLITGETGSYLGLSLRPDTYEVRAAFSGFEPESKSIELTVGQGAVLDFQLSVGLHAGDFV